jgi:hypothetical protein
MELVRQVQKLCAVSNSGRNTTVYYSICISYICLWIPPLECKINDVCLSIESGRAWVGTINIVWYGVHCTVGSTAPVTSGLFGFCYLQLWSMGLYTKDNTATNEHTIFFSCRGFFGDYFMYFIQHCFICSPSDSTVSEDAGIDLRTVAILALAVRRSNHLTRSLSTLKTAYTWDPVMDVGLQIFV